MGVAYSSPDSSYTQLCVVYTCPCGAHSTRVGRFAAFLPLGWLRLSGETCVCARCAERQRDSEPAAPERV